MNIDYSSCGPLRKRFEQDNIEKILTENEETGLKNYFDGLKEDGLIERYTYMWAYKKWVEFESRTTGKGMLIIL